MYNRFGLTLMVTQWCNLACKYCYVADKAEVFMPFAMAQKAIDRAINSVAPQGLLELGLFGGEPFLVPDMLSSVIEYAEVETRNAGLSMSVSITTNGTIMNEKVREIVSRPDVRCAFSIDGDSSTHNQNRFYIDGSGSYETVRQNYLALQTTGKGIPVIAVVTPQNVGSLKENIASLQNLGVNDIELSLDLWSAWDSVAMDKLKQAVSDSAQLWLAGLPYRHISWFDDMAVRLSGHAGQVRKCGFGKGDIAVSPHGFMYPCERLISCDTVRLPGNVLNGDDFLFGNCCNIRTAKACNACAISEMCNTTCGCCNYVRSGSPENPDKLLCLFNQWCLTETERILKQLVV